MTFHYQMRGWDSTIGTWVYWNTTDTSLSPDATFPAYQASLASVLATKQIVFFYDDGKSATYIGGFLYPNFRVNHVPADVLIFSGSVTRF